MAKSNTNIHTDTNVLERPETKEPPRFKVLAHNDDFTPMDFVVNVLMHIFDHSEADAHAIMLAVHRKGRGIAGIYPFELAETKVAMAHQAAKIEKFPFKMTIEPE